MSKMLRCYVANFGVTNAWYDGLLLDFRNNHKPVHSIVNLDNGGGKTTLLSFIFSVIDPRKDYFLKVRQNANHKVHEYFSKNGVPATCLLEWDASTPSHPRRIYVTGRCAYLRPNMEIDDVMFCYFKDSATAIEDFPGPNLGDGEPAMHWDAIQTWLVSRKKEQGFFQSSVQAHWFSRLHADGIVDSAMMRTQMKFSETEGGVDSFVSFKTQDEFLRKFIELACDDDVLDKVYQSVIDFKIKAEELPELTKCNNELQQALGILSQLQQHQTSLCAQETLVQNGIKSLLDLRAQIHRHCAKVELSFEGTKQAIDVRKQDLAIAKSQQTVLEQEERYTAAVRAHATYRTNAAQLKAKTEALDDRKNRIRHSKFLMLQKTLTEKHLTKTQIEKEIAEALHEQEPLRVLLEKAASTYNQALSRELERQAQQTIATKISQRDTVARIDAKNKSIRNLTVAMAQYELTEKNSQQSLNTLASKAQALQDVYATALDELGPFLQEKLHQFAQAQETLSEAIQRAQTLKYELTTAIQQETQKVDAATIDAKRLQSWLATQGSYAAQYQQDPMLQAIVDGIPDLSMPSLLVNIDEDITRKQELISRSIADISRLKDRVERLSSHQSEQNNSNVDTVLAWLHTHGFDQAVSAVQYIASLGPQQRQLYLTEYPLGASGVFLHPEHMPSLKTLLANEALPDIFQHVWITTFTGQENHPTNGVFFPLTNDLDYDAEKAMRLVSDLRAKLDTMHRQQHLWEKDAKTLQRLRFDLEAYQRDYSVENQEKYRLELEHKEQDIAVSQARHAELSTELEDTLANITTQQHALLLAKRNAQEQTPAMEQALHWLNHDYSRLAELKTSMQDANQKMLAAQMDLHIANQQLAQDNHALEASKDLVRTLERASQDVAAEQKTIEHANPSKDWPSSDSIEHLRSEYQRYNKQWTLTADQLGSDLQMRLALCKERISDLEKEQLPFVVENASALNMNPAEVTPESCAEHSAHLAQEEREHDELRMRTQLSQRDCMHHKETLSEEDAALDARQAAVQHELKKTELSQQMALVENESQLLVLAEESNKAMSDQVQHAVALKTMFDHSTRDIGTTTPVLDDELGQDVDLVLWTSQRDFSLAAYLSDNSELTRLRSARDHCYQQYERYRDRHPHNVYLKAQQHQDPQHFFGDGVIENGLKELGQISASMTTGIEKHQSHQATVATELTIQTSALMTLLEEALDQKVPKDAPIIGGLNVLRVKAGKTSFRTISDEERLDRVRALLDSYLSAAKPFPSTSRDLFSHAIGSVYSRPLDFQILKMVENEKERYSLVHQVKNSGAEGVTMAICLYMTILSIRNKPVKGSAPRDAGVLLIDNPFAKATTNKFWAALHNLADHYRIQFVFLTAMTDPETLKDFQHYISLTKKVDSVTGRRVLTDASITFTKKEVFDDTATVV